MNNEQVSETYRAKYNKLFTELNRRMLEHPEFGERIPQNALIVLVDENDPEFSRRNIQLAQESLAYDDLPSRPVIYIEASELAPVRSRLYHPRVAVQMPEYAAV